jgi:soluble lytic murein transglycosylase-like protein
MAMKLNFKALTPCCLLLLQLMSSAAGADSSASEVLYTAYMTSLIALETNLASLTARSKLTAKEQISLAQLKAERRRLSRRIKFAGHYVGKRSPNTRKRVSRDRLDPIVTEKSLLYGVNPDFVHAIIKCESNYDVRALSRAGAMGLMQLMPETAADLGVINPWSPAENIDGGVRYIRSLLKEFRDPWKALVSYNCGPEILRQKLPIPSESRRFAGKVLRVFTDRRMGSR